MENRFRESSFEILGCVEYWNNISMGILEGMEAPNAHSRVELRRPKTSIVGNEIRGALSPR